MANSGAISGLILLYVALGSLKYHVDLKHIGYVRINNYSCKGKLWRIAYWRLPRRTKIIC